MVCSSKSAPLQIADERGVGGVEDRDLFGLAFGVVRVGVPAVERHLHAAHAGLDQPHRGEAAAAEWRVAVRGALGGRAPC